MDLDNASVLKRLFNDSSPLSFKGGEELQFLCPFCKHYKKKLSININTGAWHCWVCGKGGKSFKSLLKNINARYEFYSLLKVKYSININNNNNLNCIALPNEYVSLNNVSNTKNPFYKRALYYCKKRGLSKEEIIRYKIGYCETGDFANRIIIPSYDSNNKLNFYCGRDLYNTSYLKYKLCNSSKNIIGFENFTNFNFNITLVEGVFDAFGVKYNVIPLFGKFLSDKLKEKLIINKPPMVNVLLDNDAIINSLKICEYLMNNSINCKLILLNGKDPSEIGFNKTWECINNGLYITPNLLLKLKMKYKFK